MEEKDIQEMRKISKETTDFIFNQINEIPDCIKLDPERFAEFIQQISINICGNIIACTFRSFTLEKKVSKYIAETYFDQMIMTLAEWSKSYIIDNIDENKMH
jgi:LytS/YehU family sensor histidine kinase